MFFPLVLLLPSVHIRDKRFGVRQMIFLVGPTSQNKITTYHMLQCDNVYRRTKLYVQENTNSLNIKL